jgi:hypothetical protein
MITIGEVRTVLSKLDINYSNSEYVIPRFNIMSAHDIYTYKSKIWEMKLYFYHFRLEGYEITLLSKYPDVRKTIAYGNRGIIIIRVPLIRVDFPRMINKI